MIANQVEQALRDNLEARSDDRELIIEILQNHGADLTDQQKNLIRALSFETITRVRRKLQQEGQYLATDRVRRARKMKGMIMQQNVPGSTSKRVEAHLQRVILPWGQG